MFFIVLLSCADGAADVALVDLNPAQSKMLALQIKQYHGQYIVLYRWCVRHGLALPFLQRGAGTTNQTVPRTADHGTGRFPCCAHCADRKPTGNKYPKSVF